MALDSNAYLDPLKYLLYREGKTCAGCSHARPLVILGHSYEACAKGRKFGVKCKLFKESE